MENHDRAYELWRSAGCKRRILLHVDAHHDMFWVERPQALTIANFIGLAIKEEIVAEVCWVVPDPVWHDRASRRALRRHLEHLAGEYPGRKDLTRWEHNRVTTSFGGAPVRVSSLASMATPREPVLLDIDTDYFITPSISYRKADAPSSVPWRWPADLVAELRGKGVRADLATVAYSVEGGYTPLRWKYLGDDVAARLRTPDDATEHLTFDMIRDAHQSEASGDLRKAERLLRRASKCAAACFNLAHLLGETNRIDEARAACRRALELDSSYRTPYATQGLNFLDLDQDGAAELEFSRAPRPGSPGSLRPSWLRSRCGEAQSMAGCRARVRCRDQVQVRLCRRVSRAWRGVRTSGSRRRSDFSV